MKTEEVATRPMSIIVPAGEGAILEAFGDLIQVKIDGEQTNGGFVLGIGVAPPGGGPPPHIHHNEDELFITIEGQCRFFANGEWTEPLGPGSVVYTPRGALHTFRNVGETPSRNWIFATPSGFEQFFSKCAAVFASPPPDMARILEISAEHGLEFVPPLVAGSPPGHA